MEFINSFWNSIENLRRVSIYFFWLSTFMFMGVILFSIARYYVDNRIKYLSEVAQSEKERRLNEDLINSRKEIESLREKTEVRSISLVKRDDMILILSKYRGSKIIIVSIMGDQECLDFASQLKEVFMASNWDVNGVNQAVYSNPIKGLIIKVKSKKYPERVNVISEAIKLIGIKLEGIIDDKLDYNDVELIIGSR